MSGLHDIFLQRVEEQVTALFTAFAEGRDASPAILYGLEGYMRAGLELQLVEEGELRILLSDLASHFLGEDMAERYRADDVLRLHMAMRKAPVYSSTNQPSSTQPTTPPSTQERR